MFFFSTFLFERVQNKEGFLCLLVIYKHVRTLFGKAGRTDLGEPSLFFSLGV